MPSRDDLNAGGLREHYPLEETRAMSYTMLPNGATLGTICVYEVDDWTWVVITDLDDKPGREYDGLDFDTDEPLVRFLVLDQLTDDEFALFEDCLGCYEHARTARLFTDSEGAGKFTPRSKFVEKFRPLGPFHPKHSREGEYDARL